MSKLLTIERDSSPTGNCKIFGRQKCERKKEKKSNIIHAVHDIPSCTCGAILSVSSRAADITILLLHSKPMTLCSNWSHYYGGREEALTCLPTRTNQICQPIFFSKQDWLVKMRDLAKICVSKIDKTIQEDIRSLLWKKDVNARARGMTRVKSRTQSSEISLKSEITVEITVFSRNLKHFSVYYHPRLIIALKSQLKSRNLVHKINPCHTPRARVSCAMHESWHVCTKTHISELTYLYSPTQSLNYVLIHSFTQNQFHAALAHCTTHSVHFPEHFSLSLPN